MLGSIPPEKMHCYYPLADLVVIPSQFQEPFCMVAIEAMGAGEYAWGDDGICQRKYYGIPFKRTYVCRLYKQRYFKNVSES